MKSRTEEEFPASFVFCKLVDEYNRCIEYMLRYLNTTKNLNLNINTKIEPLLKSYADADWAGDKRDRKSTSENVFLLSQNSMQLITKR